MEGDSEVVEALDYVPLQPPGAGRCSATHSTWAPSKVSRRAMIRPMSPEPRITTRRPTIRFLVFIRFWAVPAVYTPCRPGAGDGDGPRVRSRQPVARHHRPRLAVEQPLPGDGGEAAVRGEAGDHGPSAQLGPGGQGPLPWARWAYSGPVRVSPVPDEAKAVVDALVENAPHLVRPLQHQDGGCPCLLSALGGGQASGAAAHDDHVIVRLVHSFTLPVNSGDPAPR